MIKESDTNKISKFLSLILRHNPEKIGIELDKSGWANVDDLISKMNFSGQEVSFETLDFIVKTNKKKRFAFNIDKTKIRANQGHSIKIEHGFKDKTPPEILFHGTGKSLLKVFSKMELKNEIDITFI